MSMCALILYKTTFRELGPPDLCHVVKSSGKTGQRDLGSYHFVSGVDASSSASLAAYINFLTYADSSAWFSKTSAWKVRNNCYCCFNAFSHVDFRVDVKIPGGVDAYVVDLRGERHEATPKMWQETFVSAFLGAILYSDDPTHSLDAGTTVPQGYGPFICVPELPVHSKAGWQVGSDPEIQVASVTTNHLTVGLLKYFGASGRYQQAANLFEKIAAREPEVSSLLARAYLGMNEEVKVLQIMSAALHGAPGRPASYMLLHGLANWALKLARQAVNAAPSEFVTWEKLPEVYVELGMFESALLTLNSCPMFTFNGRDAHRQLTASRVHLPFHRSIGEILPDRVKTEDDEADPALQRLPAPGLRGTWAHAYALLTRLIAQIGWDELLKTQSAVFVMEEEYCMQKAQGDIAGHTCTESAEGTTLADGDEDNASMRGMVSPGASAIATSPESVIAPELNGNGNANANENGGIPTICISTKSDRQKDKDAAAELFSFSKKRLCERWLDNLFMVLYEVRVWTIFRAEVVHFKTQHVAYRKTGLEWETLGDLWMRLHHKEKLMDMYANEGDIQRSIQTAIRVAAYRYAEYTEMTYPTQIVQCFSNLGHVHGHAKIRYTLLSMGFRLCERREGIAGCGEQRDRALAVGVLVESCAQLAPKLADSVVLTHTSFFAELGTPPCDCTCTEVGGVHYGAAFEVQRSLLCGAHCRDRRVHEGGSGNGGVGADVPMAGGPGKVPCGEGPG
ncbi:Chs5p-Arf1p-binding proteins-domain-containing protein [Mycena galericulata]|nr:Chs5p-Arf1p-binding proteins-domain-containing protein [Mycena galericulata]